MKDKEKGAGAAEIVIGPPELPSGREMYDGYYSAALTGVLAFYGTNRTKLAVLDDMAHRMALQSMATEKMRREQAERQTADDTLLVSEEVSFEPEG